MSEIPTCTPDTPSRKRKLTVRTLETKYQAILQAESGKSKSAIAKEFDVPHNTLSTWIKNADKIKTAFANSSFAPERKRMRTAKFEDVDEAVLKWFKMVRSTYNIPVTGSLFMAKAEELARNLGRDDFSCSTGWLDRFKARHKIVLKDVCGEASSVHMDSDDIHSWNVTLVTLLQTYKPEDVYNADETGLFYKLLPNRTLDFKGSNCYGGKNSEERLTVLVCANMSGSDKLPLLVIGKAAKPKCFKHVKKLPTEYTSNKKAWMTSVIFTDWLQQLDKKMRRQDRKIALVIDNCPAHPHVKLTNIQLVFLSPKIQPMDQGVIQNLKVYYRKQVVTLQLASLESGKDVSLSVLDALHFIRTAWHNVSQNTVRNCFHHTGCNVPVTDEESDDDDDPEDDLLLSHLVYQTVSLQDYAAIDSDLATSAPASDADIIKDIAVKEENDSDDEDIEAPCLPPPSFAEASQSLSVLTRFVEARSSDPDECFNLLSGIRNFLGRSVFMPGPSAKQTLITDMFHK